MNRLLLIRHAPSVATRAGAFPADEPLDAAGQRAAARLATALPCDVPVFTSPAARCRETAAAAGRAAQVEPRLAECDFGSWQGLTLAEVIASDPIATQRWMRDPAARPHGGESVIELSARVARWLRDVRDHVDAPAVAAITHGGVIKAAVVQALGAPLEAIWKIAAEPLAIAELSAVDDGWQLRRLNVPV